MKTSPSLLIAKAMVALLLVSSGALIYSSAFALSTTTLTLAVSGSLTCNIITAAAATVESPGVTMSTAAYSNTAVATSTGTLGADDQRLGITNPTTTAAWSLTLGATSGATTTWSSGSATFDFNDGASGADNNGVTDDDTVGGQLTVDPSGGSITGTGPEGDTSSTANITLGSSTAFAEGTSTANSVTIATATSSAAKPGQWYIKTISLSQIVPKRTAAGTYTLGMTLTLS